MHRREFLRLASITSGAFTLSGPAILQAGAETALPAEDAADSLYHAFREPAMQYRPMVRWWWNGDRVTGTEILRELDVLKAAGIGGVEINPIKFPGDAESLDTKSLQWLSREWIDVLEVALKGAKERGMTCDMIVGSGWPYGGEFLTREEQSQMVAIGTRDVTGPTRLQVSRAELLSDVNPRITSPQPNTLKDLIGLSLVPYDLQNIDMVKSLKDQVGSEQIVLDVPEGKHVLYSLVKLTGYMAVINGAPGSSGPVLNHLEKAAVERYLNRLSDALTARIGDLHPYLRAFFTDSIELEGANWCHDIAEVFQQRHQYDLMPWLPFILFKVGEMGNAISGHYGAQFGPSFQQQVEAVRYDFQTLRRQLFNERFVSTFAAWCTRLGVKSRMQAYGTECDVMTASTLLDIPECETWIRSEKIEPFEAADYSVGRNYTMINKFVSSAAHLSGKQLISCEEMTNTDDPFGVSLNRIKAAGDQSVLSGVTQSVLHGFNYSPPEIPFPGWVRYGTYFSEHNTWWPYFHLWADYKARISSVLQHSVMQADVAILPPYADLASRFGFQRDPFPSVAYPPYLFELWEAVHQNGNSCDYITEDVIQRSDTRGGKLRYQQRAYSTILLPDVDRLNQKTAQMLAKFVAAGGKLLFLNRIPSEGEGRAGERDANTIAALMNDIQRKYPQRAPLLKVDVATLTTWFSEIQRRFELSPGVKLSDPNTSISQVHYKQGDREIFFFANYGGEQTRTFDCTFRNWRGRNAWLWDAETGERHQLSWAATPGTLALTLGPAQSALIVLNPGQAKSNTAPDQASQVAPRNSPPAINAKWQIELASVSGKQSSFVVEDWSDPALATAFEGFAGTITGSAKVQLDASQDHTLDLGVLHSISEAWINGRALGIRWYGNQSYDIRGAVLTGENDLKIRLTTTLGNYMKTLKGNKTAQDWSRNTPSYPVGLISGVQLE